MAAEMLEPNDIAGLLSQITSLADLDRLAVSKDGKTPKLLFGHAVELFPPNTPSYQERQDLVRFIDDYITLFRDHITHYHPYDGRRLKKIADFDYLDYFTREMERLPLDDDEGTTAEVYGFPSAKDRDEPTPYYAMALADAPRYRVNIAHCYLPATWPERNGYDAYIDRVIRWCNILHPCHGTAGLSIIFEEGKNPGSDGVLAFPLIKRFPGLDYPNPTRWSVCSEGTPFKMIRSINWLTVLDWSFVGRLGGIARVESTLGADCPIHSYDDGIVIQAGPRPELGDLNRGIVPEAYRRVAHLVRPIRFEDYDYPLIEVRSPLDEIDETVKWIRRFD